MDIRQTFHELLLITFLLCMDSGLSFKDDEDYFDEPSFNRCPWIRNKLKNGRVRYRYKGRVAKFLCDSGFELAGKRSSTCVRGQWSNPVPVCVARGCNRVNSIANGRITEMYRGALLVYDCNPGYVLDGSATIHCDGRKWNTSPPVCVIATEKPETYCDFENPDLCGWSQDPNHDFDWQRNQFSTPSGHVGTGPAFDHTFGENKGGFYLFIEASSPRKRNDTARLFSPVFPPDLSGGCFIFWYHMYGATTGGLRVYLKPESHVFDELKSNWEKHGDQGNQWLKGHMIVPVLHENFQIVIEGIRGESYVGDSAIDDVRLTTNLCGSDDNSTDTTETTDQYSCRGRCQESGSESSCGCNANCIDEPNFCCRDYYTICTAENSTTMQNPDEPLPEDYTTSSSVTTQSTSYTTLQRPEENITSTANLQTEKLDSINVTSSVSSSTSIPPTTSYKITSSTIKPIPVTTEELSKETSIETRISRETTISTGIVPSTMLKMGTSTTSTSIKTTQYVSTDTSTSTTSTTPSTTSLKTTITSTTPQTTSTTPQTTIPTTPKTTTEKIKSTPQTSTRISTLSTTLETTSQTAPITILVNNSTTTVSNFPIDVSISTDIFTSSSSAATTTNTEPIRFSTTTLSSTRRTYNLRPRNRTVSTIAYTTSTVPSTTQTPLIKYTSTKDSTSGYSLTTTSPLTSWFRYSISFPKEQSTTSLVKLTTTTRLEDTSTRRPVISQTTIENLPQTTKFSSRFTRPTKSTMPKTSDFYESKAKTTSSNSSVPIIISVVIVALICITAGVAYYFRKQRSKRQSKLSDDSEMRFLPESDFMEYSDASALDRILVK